MDRTDSLPDAAAPVYSAFADDADFSELLGVFVAEVHQRRGEMQAHFDAADYGVLRIKAHQLKGAGGGYGFKELTILAGELEVACISADRARIAGSMKKTLAFMARISF